MPHSNQLPKYNSIIVATDASDYSNQATQLAIEIGSLFSSTVTGSHTYAAKLHDKRFRQMEGGLPEQYREEDELEKQRDIHDDLITKGLGVITDSYLDQIEESVKKTGLKYQRKSLEGKNYTELVKEVNTNNYDLLLIGAKGLGALPTTNIGTVCDRTVRRSNIDTLVVKQLDKPIKDGSILIAIDGSEKSYGGLLRAFALAKHWKQKVFVISVYDPYYHYVAFNRIASVLSDEASKVFKFKEQEKLHEDIIDAGLAKIYQGHLDVAKSIAKDFEIDIETKLLDGKPHDAIEKFSKKIQPSLLVVGKLGIHADDELDIGGNADNLLNQVECNILFSQFEFKPRLDVMAEATIKWSIEAESKMHKVPSFARNMAKTAILRMAQDRGHTVITENLVAEAMQGMCPVKPSDDNKNILENESNSYEFTPKWSNQALELAKNIEDKSVRENAKKRAEKKARTDGSMLVSSEYILEFMPDAPKKCHFGFSSENNDSTMQWDTDAKQKLKKVPDGFMRRLTKQRVEKFAKNQGKQKVDVASMEAKYDDWEEGSNKQSKSMKWDDEAERKIAKIPDFVQGMVILETEKLAQSLNLKIVSYDILKKASRQWGNTGEFHSN